MREIETADEQSGSEAFATPNSSSSVTEHELVLTEIFGGTTRTGGVVSVPVTVTVCVQDTTWVSTSVAVHSIVVIPTGYGSVNATPSLRCAVIVAVAEFAVAVPTLTPVAGSQPVGDGTVTFAGQLIVRR